MSTPAHRSPKGEARRAQILDEALAVLTEHRYDDTTIAQIAERVGVTPSGVMHYFPTKSSLFAEVLSWRQTRWQASRPPHEGQLDSLSTAVLANQNSRGIVELYANTAVRAVDPAHEAHQFFQSHFHDIAQRLRADLEQRQLSGELAPEVDVAALARILMAVSDGLQVQWLFDADVRVAADYTTLLSLLGLSTTPLPSGSTDESPARSTR